MPQVTTSPTTPLAPHEALVSCLYFKTDSKVEAWNNLLRLITSKNRKEFWPKDVKFSFAMTGVQQESKGWGAFKFTFGSRELGKTRGWRTKLRALVHIEMSASIGTFTTVQPRIVRLFSQKFTE